MSGRMRAWMVYPIFLVVWVIVLCGFQFGKWKKQKVEYGKQLAARNASRGKYGSDTNAKDLWPGKGRPDKSKKGAADKKQDEDKCKAKLEDLKVGLKAAETERDAHKKELRKVLDAKMVGINEAKFDYEKPDQFVLELLKQQRDDAGPRLIRFLDGHYKNLFFRFPIPVPAPNINLTGASLPPCGPQGSLSWPVGSGPLAMTVYGRYDDLLDFVSTFPDKFDRTAQISSFSLQRLAFDFNGSVLLQLNCTIQFFVWPNHAPGSPGGGAAGAAPAPGGAPGAPPGASPPGGSGGGTPPPPGGAGGSGAPLPGPPGGSK